MDDSSDQPAMRPVFTSAQAARGQVLYESFCAGCHGLNLISDDPSVASLTATEFRTGWQGKTILERLKKISGTMPPGGATNFALPDYLDIIAYILMFNGYSPGKEELPHDLATLETMTINSRALIE